MFKRHLLFNPFPQSVFKTSDLVFVLSTPLKCPQSRQWVNINAFLSSCPS